ncbi:MAG: hypothetical protein ACI9G1_005976, partial [Pirellulaceae bacterium]
MTPIRFFLDSFTLNALCWTVLIAIPFGIILLYFLKLRRAPLEVPSTYLWSRTIEDLHVNSLWQRLRQSLLLFLQLLLLLLIIIACLFPWLQGTELKGGRLIFLVDVSASMAATDTRSSISRLDAAKVEIAKLIDKMESGHTAMIISFADQARVEQSFTDSRSRLRMKLNQVKLTNRTTNLDEALRTAAGLANPGSSGESSAEARAATMYIFSDGGFAATEFSLGTLTPEYKPMGESS